MAQDSIEEGVKDERFYTLSEFQYTNLIQACQGSNCFAVPLPNDKDSPEAAEKLSGLRNEIGDLLQMGLLEDVSSKFNETLQVSKINIGREFIVVAVTDAAKAMFEEGKKGKPN